MSRKKKKRHEEHIDESWLVPYADILTLCLALFIVLFASSSVDAEKFQKMSEVFNQVFTSGTGFMDYPSTTNTENSDSLNSGGIKGKTEQEELSNVQAKVNSYIQNEKLDKQLSTSLTDEGLLVTIEDNVLFESGVGEVREKDKKIAKEISSLLVMDPPRSIVISGHTDNVPIKNNEYDSNWDLSVMRAVNFMKVLLENDKLKPEWFSAKGFGEFKPVASNNTAEGRAKNRRVEILIMPRTEVDK